MAEQLLPGLTHELDGTRLNPDAHFKENAAAEACAFHGSQVCVHAFTGKVAVHEVPVDPGARVVGRPKEVVDDSVWAGECEAALFSRDME